MAAPQNYSIQMHYDRLDVLMSYASCELKLPHYTDPCKKN